MLLAGWNNSAGRILSGDEYGRSLWEHQPVTLVAMLCFSESPDLVLGVDGGLYLRAHDCMGVCGYAWHFGVVSV